MDVDDGLANTTPSFTISVDKEKAAKYGMTVAQVFQLVYGEMASVRASAAYSGFRFVLKMHKLVGRHK